MPHPARDAAPRLASADLPHRRRGWHLPHRNQVVARRLKHRIPLLRRRRDRHLGRSILGDPDRITYPFILLSFFVTPIARDWQSFAEREKAFWDAWMKLGHGEAQALAK